MEQTVVSYSVCSTISLTFALSTNRHEDFHSLDFVVSAQSNDGRGVRVGEIFPSSCESVINGYRRLVQKFWQISLLLLMVFPLCSLPSKVFAVPACPQPFELKQPSGKTFETRQHGDEWYSPVETKDGYGIYMQMGILRPHYQYSEDTVDTMDRQVEKVQVSPLYSHEISGSVGTTSPDIPKGLFPASGGNFIYGDTITMTNTILPTESATSTYSITPKIASGEEHCLALDSNGTVWAWGYNYYGQLGDGTNNNRKNPPVQVSNVSDIIAIAAGLRHSLALKSDGTVWTWGDNGSGQLGNGTTTNSNTPVQISGLNGIIAIASGFRHCLALKSDGTVWTWGENTSGQLGDGTTTNSTIPIKVSSLNDVIAIAGGWSHSLALKSDGTVWGWGNNGDGQLGDETNTSRKIPVLVSKLVGVTGIACGHYHSLALKSDGTVWTWGNNIFGALGDGTTTRRNTAGQISSLSGITAINGGEWHSLALKSDGTVWSWGYNYYGQLGDSTYTDRSSPVQVNGLSGITAIAGGKYHSLAMKSDGTVWVWGYNPYGSLGVDTSAVVTPTQVEGLIGVTDVAGGKSHSLALKSDDTVWTWGYYAYGQSESISTKRISDIPVQVNNLNDVTVIACGGSHSLALKPDGTVWAWGYNGYGQLGDGTTTNSTTPILVNGFNGVTAIAGGGTHTAALKSDGTVWTWGANTDGQLGDGTYTDRSSPVQVNGLSGTITAIACGWNHTLALKSDGTVWAWGANDSGQLGDGTSVKKPLPVQVSGISGVTAIAGGRVHSIALKSDGTVWTWGSDDLGQLADGGTFTNSTTPVQVRSGLTGFLGDIIAIASGANHSLALKSNGTVYFMGQYWMGWGYYGNWNVAMQKDNLSNVNKISCGGYHNLALKSDGTVWAWGENGWGEVGNGTSEYVNTPVKIDNFSLTITSTTTTPIVTTGSAINITTNSATLNGTVNANDLLTMAWFQYGTSSGSYGLSSSVQNISGMSNIPVSSDISGLSGNTTYYYRMAARNGEGTTYGNELSFTSLVPQDTTAPSGSVSINSGASYTNSLTVSLTLTATDSVGVTGYYLSSSSTSPSASASNWISVTSTTSYSATVSYSLSSGESSKIIYVWYKDAAENVSSTASDSIILDTTAPTVTITSPTSNSTYTTSSSTISLSGSASDSGSGISSATWSNSKGGSGTASGTTSWSISNISLSSGENVITVTATDGVGYTGTDTITVTYTTSTRPTPTATTTPTPSTSPTPSSTPTPTSTCTDDYEPNDSFSTAYGHLVSQSSYSGKICTPFDDDYFKINVASPGIISLILNIPPDKDYDLYLYDSNQSMVAFSIQGFGVPEIITYFANTPGTYYIWVFGYGSFDENQTYTLSGTWETTATTPTPPPIVCEAESIKTSQARLVLGKRQSGKVTVSVIGTNCPVEDMIVEVTITVGSRCISVSPVTQQTDENGKATFVIKAKDKIGRAKVTFKAGILEKTLRVRVKRQ